ncbi:hypothetical protein FGU65_12050 [Methanoculleus sp. FWC-SCC1]|uniref:Tetratricopeptide repeat protein n=1 Tax=Methanoculleus frigidifontis TaxID=2584085 RepID=A0ABT8MCF6_9EURY|nr:hypothetical protein [Methanoculleus sp. FWC-SCC1]MDN7025614.1 hypothetical protein [Methanoculleus sp. FWC-SCC1]
MATPWQPEAIQNRRLEQLKASMNEYIERSIDKIEGNLPVFFGHVAATLDKSFPSLPDRTYDEFIDAITLTLLNTTRQQPNVEFLEKVLRHAMGNKRRRQGRATLDIIAGLKLISSGNYSQGLEYLLKYRNIDARINTTIAYCFYRQGSHRIQTNQPAKAAQPRDMELHAREEMIALIRANPPVNRLKIFNYRDSQLDKIFWHMHGRALEWFPSEPAFLRLGIRKARVDGDLQRRRHLIALATERFHDDKQFLIEAYTFEIEQRNGIGAAGIVKQMMQQYPDDREPIYFGMKLAIFGAQASSYYSFRKLAILKEFPERLLLLLDTAFELMCGRQSEAALCYEEAKKTFSRRNHYAAALEYIFRDTLDSDAERAKRAKGSFIASIDHYCMQTLGIAQD